MKATLALLLLLSSCAQYKAVSLCQLTPQPIYEKSPHFGVATAAKAFTSEDCRKYLGRDVIKKGYQPVQLCVENATDKTYFFSPESISLPLVLSNDVALKVHTSTFGRVASYCAAAVVASPFFVVPALIDGFKSSHANERLDFDFASKSAKEQILRPKEKINVIFFILKENYEESFTLTLLEEASRRPAKFIVKMQNLSSIPS